MENVGTYILTVSAAGLICGIANTFLSGKGNAAAAAKLVSGIFLVLVVMQPLTKLPAFGLTDFWGSLEQEGAYAAEAGEEASQENMASIIKTQLEAYILDKAAQMDAPITVEVMVQSGQIPVIESVSLYGTVSPYAKGKLTQSIETDLGIRKEDQHWISE